MASNAVNKVDPDIITHTDAHTFSGTLTATGTESHTGTETHTGAVTLSGTNTLSGPTTISGSASFTGGTTTSGNLKRSEGTLAAAGSDQAGAAAIVNDITIVTGADGTKGTRLPTGVAGMQLTVINTVASVLKVYPAGTGTIDGGSASAALSQAASKVGIYSCTAADVWYSLVGA